jgi:transcription initiation factor TFIIIB Brf1 subunit/transcription initiation factor TFIIB
MPESSLGTMILVKNGSSLMRRIKRYHMWNLMPYRERTLWTIFESLQVRASNVGIGTAVLEEAKELFAQLTASAICRGQKQRDAMLAACLWEALKRHETPRMPKDIADIFNIELCHVTKGIKQFQHLFAIRTSGQLTDTYANQATKTEDKKDKADTIVESDEVISARAFQRRAIWQKTASRTTTYEDFIVPFLTNLAVPRSALESLVRHVCARTEELGIVPENTPPSLTASVIAFCAQHAGLRIDTAEIARVCGISAVTIQKCLKRMMLWKEKLLEQ